MHELESDWQVIKEIMFFYHLIQICSTDISHLSEEDTKEGKIQTGIQKERRAQLRMEQAEIAARLLAPLGDENPIKTGPDEDTKPFYDPELEKGEMGEQISFVKQEMHTEASQYDCIERKPNEALKEEFRQYKLRNPGPIRPSADMNIDDLNYKPQFEAKIKLEASDRSPLIYGTTLVVTSNEVLTVKTETMQHAPTGTKRRAEEPEDGLIMVKKERLEG
ncbi:hypothetical protein FRC12_024506 [Ceratobasidium sp. 428]|nr:hypothetical protein FRC12_024506 [Ceratobasidium sp. 428]